MTVFAPRSGLASQARVLFISAIVVFTYTIIIGILNGTDIWEEPEHDALMSHVHGGTLGWITLGVAATALLMYSRDREVSPAEQRRVTLMTYALIPSVVLYVLAFLVGDSLFSERQQRPVFGTILLLVVIWFLVWLIGTYRAYTTQSAARLGILLGWISLLIGAVFGIVLGVAAANDGKMPGLGVESTERFADAHPPAMVIGYLLVVGFASVEWLLHDGASGRLGAVQMWLLFAAGLVINIAFVSGKDEELAGPANLLMIAAGLIMLWRSRSQLLPAGWRGSGVGKYPRFALIGLVGYLVLLTVLVSWIVRDVINFDSMTPKQEGLLLAFDHTMFIGVMTNVLFGVIAANFLTQRTAIANRVLWFGVNIGIVGFAIGLITVNAWFKRIFTPIMGVALLVGLAIYFTELLKARPARD